MPQYKYTAVTQDNQKMTGSLSANSENEARQELNELKLAILSIEEVSSNQESTTTPSPHPITTQQQPEEKKPIPEPKQKSQPTNLLKKFEFEGIDKTGRKIVGTIPANDKISALERLAQEYQFDINYLAPTEATQAEKDFARQEGIEKLKEQLADLDLTKKELEKETKEDKNFKEKQTVLMKKVDYVLEKIKKVLTEFGEEIKPENKQLIQGYINKLLRIKNSTNLEYIEHTTEELLKKIQDQEIFLNKETLTQEKAKLMVESEALMSSLHSDSVTKTTLTQDIDQKLSKLKIPAIQKFTKALSEKFKKDPETESLKSLIKTTNRQLFTYLKIWLKSLKNKDAKNQAEESIKAVLEERKSLKNQIRTLQNKETKIIKKPSNKDTLLSEVTNFLGWLLSFYLIYYFATYYAATKDIPYELNLPWDPDITKTPLIKYLVAIIFMWYILLAIKTKFAPGKAFLTPILGLTGLVLTVLTVFNF
ncbi:MAG: hypothetical protein ABII07_04300 [Patescibacteria group bacterium]|nr:hypothetical protein [Patescibacteria group bacterium]